MNFLKDSQGCFIRIDRVCEAQPDRPGYLKLLMDTGEQRQATIREWDRAIERSQTQVVPAAPGTVQLFGLRAKGQNWIVKQPVIAWCVDRCGTAAAITSAGSISGDDVYPAIQNPDGSVEDAVGLYETYEQWLATIGVD